MHAVAVATAFSVLAGCAYRAGSFDSVNQEFTGSHTSAGCLDLAIERRPDLERRPVVAYAFGNRCDVPTVVDLANVAVVARTTDAVVTLKPYDPEQEIVARELDAHAVGSEAIAYLSESPAHELCVDAASIAQVGEPRWLCFAAAGKETP